jgi:hypothetical protein
MDNVSWPVVESSYYASKSETYHQNTPPQVVKIPLIVESW